MRDSGNIPDQGKPASEQGAGGKVGPGDVTAQGDCWRGRMQPGRSPTFKRQRSMCSRRSGCNADTYASASSPHPRPSRPRTHEPTQPPNRSSRLLAVGFRLAGAWEQVVAPVEYCCVGGSDHIHCRTWVAHPCVRPSTKPCCHCAVSQVRPGHVNTQPRPATSPPKDRRCGGLLPGKHTLSTCASATSDPLELSHGGKLPSPAGSASKLALPGKLLQA